MKLRDLPAPIVTGSLVVLLVLAVCTWGWRPGGGSGPDTVHVSRTRAKLFDGACVFAADVQLDGTFGRFTFGRHYLDIRDALIDVLRTKPEYMVRTALARESLRLQMAEAVNRVAGRRIATDLRFTEFRTL
jgi:hypothetical protein